MEQMVALNIVALIFLFFAGLFFGREDERLFYGIALLWISFCASIFGWIVFVVVHYLRKTW